VKKAKKYMEITGKIAKYARMTGIGTQELAASALMGRTTYYNRLRDPGNFTIDELCRIGKRLHIPPDEMRNFIAG
jgi:DNA-binding phage protein